MMPVADSKTISAYQERRSFTDHSHEPLQISGPLIGRKSPSYGIIALLDRREATLEG